jgi:hypothetical protein
MGIGDIGGHLADAVAAEFQRAAGGDLRIQLAQAAGRGVARVGEGLAADFQLRGVERSKPALDMNTSPRTSRVAGQPCRAASAECCARCAR